MGNCINKSKIRPQTEAIEPSDTAKNGGNMRVKIVLTKEELQLLMHHLENTKGTRVEDVLDEIQRKRERTTHVVWKPSLDSIVE